MASYSKRLLVLLERRLEKALFVVKELALFELLDYLGRLTVLIGVITFIVGIPQRREQAKINREAVIFQAWQVIKLAEGDKSRVAALALERLASQDFTLQGLELSGTYLGEMDLEGANFQDSSLTESRFLGSQLKRSNFSGAELDGSWMINTNLTRAKLVGASLKKVKFTDSNLAKADLESAILSGAEMTKVVLTGANLTNALIDNVDFFGADLTDVSFEGSNMKGTDVERAAVLCNTILPGNRIINRDC